MLTLGGMEMVTFSFTALSSYQKCPKQYEFRYVQKREAQQTKIMLEGSIAHYILELLYNHTVEEAISAAITKYGSYDDVMRIFVDIGNFVTEDFFDHTESVELPFNVKLGDYNLKGVFDRIDKIGDDYYIIDYKYGNTEYKQVNGNLQPSIYAYALMQIKNVPRVFFSYYNIKQKTNVTGLIEKDSQEIKQLYPILDNVYQSILAGLFPAKPSYNCVYCMFKDICTDYSEWIKKSFDLNENMTFDDIIESFIDVGNKANIMKSKSKEMETFIREYMISNGLSIYNGKRRVVLTKEGGVIVD